MRTTNRHQKYWRERKIDWQKSYFNPNHPHRKLILEALKSMNFGTVYEMGCAAGANLYRVAKQFPGTRVGGVDISEAAIEEAKRNLPPSAVLEARSSEDVFMNDKSVCILLSDMHFIYYSPKKIKKVLTEVKRVTRNNIILVEFHSSSWWKRFKLWWKSGYFAHDYKKLLPNYGFYDIELYKLTEQDWPGGQPQKSFAYLITAKI